MTVPRIIFVDDELPVHEMMRTILEGKITRRPLRLFTTTEKEETLEEQEPSYRIDYFSEPEAARQAIENACRENLAYSLLITDIRMPGHDGTWMIREARRIDPNIRIIVFTSYADSTVKELTVSVGGKDFIYLEKTVSPTVIKQAVDSELTTWKALFSNRRLLERLPFTDEVHLRSPEKFSGLAVDISAGGIGLMNVPEEIEVGSFVELELKVDPMAIKGRVRWLQKKENSYRVGIQFEEQDQDLVELAKRVSGRQT